MKKLFLFLLAALMCGAASASITMPKHLVVAGQSDKQVKVYNCKTKATYSLSGYLRNVGVDNSGNVYVLVANQKNGWGSYTVYKNSSIYMSLTESGNMQYSSMAMCVKGNNVVIAGSQVKKFNSKGYEARQVGYNNKVRVYETDWERKSLKRDQFKGYCNITGSGTKTKVEPIYDQNESGCPEGVHLSVEYHVDAVDYCDGFIYATGWGEREYTETPIGYQKQYLVRRCPRVWKNGHNVVEQYENQTGAAWNISVFKVSGKELIFTSGHHRDKPCAWEHSTDQFSASSGYVYPCIVSEATFQAGAIGGQPIFCRVFLIKTAANTYVEKGIYVQGDKTVGNWTDMNDNSTDVVAGKKSFYKVTNSANGVIVKCKQNCTNDNNGYSFKDVGTLVTLPADFKVKDAKIAVCE